MLNLQIDLLKSAEKPVTEEKLLESARYVAKELPIRLARRVRSIQQLPFIVGLTPHVRKAYVLYHESFENIRSFPPIESLDDDKCIPSISSSIYLPTYTSIIWYP